MSEVTTAKAVNLYQLGLEMGGPGLRMVDRGNETVIKSDADQSTLDAAIAAHTADPSIVGDPSVVEPTDAERIADLEAVIAALLEA